MKIIIQSRKTKLFFKSSGLWTKHVEKAKSFGGVLMAFYFVEMNLLKDTEVVFIKEESREGGIIGEPHDRILNPLPA